MHNDRARSQLCFLVAKEARDLSCDCNEKAGLISWEFPEILKGLVKILPVLPAGKIYRSSFLKS